MTDSQLTPQEQPVATETAPVRITIGLPAQTTATERRFPLTPEAVQILADNGYTVRMEAGAGEVIHYPDARYTRHGATIATRDECLRSDIVIHLSSPAPRDIRAMRAGAVLLTFERSVTSDRAVAQALMRQGVTSLAIDLIEDSRGNTPFADSLAELDGRAAIAIAAAALADADDGKGILIGGIPGVVPCEVLVIGSGDAAVAAAKSAAALGAIVRMMDNDVYRLRRAAATLPAGVICTTLHPRGLASALRTADVIVSTPMDTELQLDADERATLKKGVLIYDLSPVPNTSLRSGAAPSRPAALAPRTAAMAMSNAFITLFAEVTESRSALNAIKLLPGLQRAALTFAGRAVNHAVALAAGVRYSNLSIYLSLS